MQIKSYHLSPRSTQYAPSCVIRGTTKIGGERYDAVRANIKVEILKPLTESYTNKMNHCVLKFDNFSMANRIGNYILLNFGSPCYAMTVVGGVYPDGSDMEPSIHILFFRI